MFYTTEEAAIVCGFLDLYLNRDSVDRAVREQNRKFQRSAARGDLRREDYREVYRNDAIYRQNKIICRGHHSNAFPWCEL